LIRTGFDPGSKVRISPPSIGKKRIKVRLSAIEKKRRAA